MEMMSMSGPRHVISTPVANSNSMNASKCVAVLLLINPSSKIMGKIIRVKPDSTTVFKYDKIAPGC